MNDTEMYAIYGRKQVELDNLNEQYDRLLAILAKVAGGEVHPQQVVVDLTARSWVITATSAVVEPEPGPVVQ